MKTSIVTLYNEDIGERINEAINCYKDIADEVFVMRGRGIKQLVGVNSYYYYWERNKPYTFRGEQIQRGYDVCTGDWVLVLDNNMFIHEDDKKRILGFLKRNNEANAVNFNLWDIFIPDRYFRGRKGVIAFNKKKLGDKLRFVGGYDGCQPTIVDGNKQLQVLTPYNTKQSNIKIFVYNYTFFCKNEIIPNITMKSIAYYKSFNKWLYTRYAFNGWYAEALAKSRKGRLIEYQFEHPMYVKQLLKDMKPYHLGYSLFNKRKCRFYD